MNKKVVWLPYDFDTAIGINNEGALVFSYNLEDTDYPGGETFYDGRAQESVVWNNVRDAFASEIKSMYATLRSSGKLSYDLVEQMFEEHQGKWPEALFNEDSYFKYIQPLVESGANYLEMLQGAKSEQRKWWLYNRFRYMDSKFNAGDALTDYISFRAYGTGNVTITPYADIYAAAKFESYLVMARGARNTPTVLASPAGFVMGDTQCTIYSASQLADIGDMSPLKLGLIDIAMATKLQRLKIGDSDSSYENRNLYSLSFGNNVLLQTIDARNCSGLGDTSIQGHTQTTVDASGCTNVEHVYFEGTKVASVSVPNGGILKTLHLPKTITNLTVRNQPSLTSFSVEDDDYSNITTLRVENSGSAIPVIDILDELPANSRVRLIGFTTTASTTAEVEAFFDHLDTMKGLDENGNNLENAVASGTITGLGTITGAWLAQMKARYPDIDIQYEHITSNLYYYNGSTLYYTETITDGGNGVYAGTPTKASTAQYSYTFTGWSKTDDNTVDSDARQAVTADRSVYACYSSTVRKYTVTWKNSNGTVLETDYDVPYGTRPTYNGATPQNPTSGGGAFTGWTPAITNVTGNVTYTASYVVMYTVRFYNGTTLLDTVQVQSGGTATYTGATPVDPDGGTFKGWEPSNTNVTSNRDCYAQFKPPVRWETPGIDVSGAYAVQWPYSGDATALARGGLAAAFADPSPATSKAGTGSSPFDNIAPWKDMKRYNIINGAISYSQDDAGFSETDYDTVVYIPEFYFCVEKDTANQRWTWSISPTAKTGYTKHPGSGRYIGRFHTSGDSTEVFSKSGVAPLVNSTRANFRTYSHNKGTKWWMLDLATWSALQMLYLVEFADFHSQSTLGTGHNTGSAGNTGGTTGAAYHTLKVSAGDNMYRWVENPFSQVRDWVDGAYFSSRAAYVGTDNATFADSTTGLTNVGITLPSSNYITGFGYSASCPWAFIPDAASGGSASTYVPDYVSSSAGSRALYVGGSYFVSDNCGFFYFSGYFSATYTDGDLGSRLLYIP